MSGTTENIPHRILFSRIPRDITDLIFLLLHFSHCSRHRNMSFRSLFCMHGYEHNKCFPFQTGKCSGQCTGGHCPGPSHGPWCRILDLIAGCLYIFLPACDKGSVCFFQSCQQSFWRQDLKGNRFVDTTVFSSPSDLHSSNSGVLLFCNTAYKHSHRSSFHLQLRLLMAGWFSRISVRGSV